MNWINRILFASVLCFVIMDSVESKRAGDLARATTSIQYDLALKIGNRTTAERVYLFDHALYFKDAEDKIVDCIRYKEKDGKVAVLSQACQGVLQNSNEYVQFCENVVNVDLIGVYVIVSSQKF